MSIELKQAAEQALDLSTPTLREMVTRHAAVIDSRATLLREFNAIHQAEAQQPATPEPVQADSSEHLRVIASLGDALRRLSFAAQTTGGTAGPDVELQSAIGQAEQALSLGGIWQAMSATGEPVGFTYQAEIEYANSTGGNGSFWRVPPDLDDEAVPLYARPAPSVPDDVVRDAERYRWLADCNNYEAGLALIIDPKLTAHTLGEKIDAAMLAAKDTK